jgi:hypothetical protein
MRTPRVTYSSLPAQDHPARHLGHEYCKFQMSSMTTMMAQEGRLTIIPVGHPMTRHTSRPHGGASNPSDTARYSNAKCRPQGTRQQTTRYAPTRIAEAKKVNDKDVIMVYTPTLHVLKPRDDYSGWRKAPQTKIDPVNARGTWELIPRPPYFVFYHENWNSRLSVSPTEMWMATSRDCSYWVLLSDK